MFRSVTFEYPPDVINSGREGISAATSSTASCLSPASLAVVTTISLASMAENSSISSYTDLEEVSVGEKETDLPFVGKQHVDGVKNEGLLYYKYIPRINTPGVADVERAVLLPGSWPDVTVEKAFQARNGKAAFIHSAWQDLPKFFHVVNALADLDLLEFMGASLTFSRGGKDLSDMRALD